VRQKLLEKQVSMERSEKAKKLRDLRKYGKKVLKWLYNILFFI